MDKVIHLTPNEIPKLSDLRDDSITKICPECKIGKVVAVGNARRTNAWVCDNKRCNFSIIID